MAENRLITDPTEIKKLMEDYPEQIRDGLALVQETGASMILVTKMDGTQCLLHVAPTNPERRRSMGKSSGALSRFWTTMSAVIVQ